MSYIRQALRLKKRKELFFHSAGVDDGWGMKHLYIYISLDSLPQDMCNNRGKNNMSDHKLLQ